MAFERGAIGALIIGDEILSGKRLDKHLAHVGETLGARGIVLDYACYLGDDCDRIAAALRETFRRGDLLFSFGGIGATPDDHTRQAVAAALGVDLFRHPQAVAEIEARFGAAAYPYRVLMAEFPQGASIIPNPVNRIAGFSVHDHHFLPGFPNMAWPMLEWVLETRYAGLRREASVERMLVVHDVGESEFVALMNENADRFPGTKVFSLPSYRPDGGRRIELGVRGPAGEVEPAFAHLHAGIVARGFSFEVDAGGAGGSGR